MPLADSVSHQLLTMKHMAFVLIILLPFTVAAPRGVVVPEVVQDFHDALMSGAPTVAKEASGTDTRIGSNLTIASSDPEMDKVVRENGYLTIASGEPEMDEVVTGGVIQTISSITITYIVICVILIWFSLFWICCCCLTSPCCFWIIADEIEDSINPNLLIKNY